MRLSLGCAIPSAPLLLKTFQEQISLTPEQQMVSMIRKLLLPALHLYSGFEDTFFLPFLALYSFENMLVTTLGWPEQEGQEASSPTWPPGERRWLRQQPLFPPSQSR